MLDYLSVVPVRKNAHSMGNKQQELEISVCVSKAMISLQLQDMMG